MAWPNGLAFVAVQIVHHHQLAGIEQETKFELRRAQQIRVLGIREERGLDQDGRHRRVVDDVEVVFANAVVFGPER